jgi:hypothetical protein
MAPDYRPKIKKQSQAKTLAEFDSAMDWLEKLPGVSSIGRFQTYRDNLSKVFRLILENRTDQILKQISPPEFIETHFEANALIEVWRQFQRTIPLDWQKNCDVLSVGNRTPALKAKRPNRSTSCSSLNWRRFLRNGVCRLTSAIPLT